MYPKDLGQTKFVPTFICRMYIVFVNFVMLTQGSRGVYCQADLAQLVSV